MALPSDDVTTTHTAAPALAVIGLGHQHGAGPTAVRALDHVDLAFSPGTFTAVMGPSGSGKSTFLTCAGALERPTTGTVLVAGQDVTALDEDDRSRVHALLATVGLEGRRGRRLGFGHRALLGRLDAGRHGPPARDRDRADPRHRAPRPAKPDA